MNLFSKTDPLMAFLLRGLFRLGVACALLAVVPTFEGRAFAQQQAATQGDPVRATLGQFGNFVAHPKYGEVWMPTVTPQDWHPYAPCNWVNSKVGWYYNDSTPWGAIVHHYGRWTHDDQMGWIWIPGGEFSPGWVVWRSDRQWIGWAPMPPDEEMQTVSSDSFNAGDTWIFQDIATFERGCTGPARIAPRDHIVPLLIATTFVTEIEIIDGIAIYVLPPYIGGPVIDIVFDFQPWSPAFFAQVVIDWNFIWNNLNAPGAPCPPIAPAQQAGGGNPPPSGGGLGGGNPPPGGGGFQTCPDGSLLPVNVQCPVKVVATCFNGMLPPSLCQNFPIICGAGHHALGNTCIANVVCTPPATPDSSGIACVTPDAPTNVAGGGCNGPNGAYAGCSGGGLGGGGGAPNGGGTCLYGGTPPKCNGPPSDVTGGSGCGPASTLNGTSGYCQADGSQTFTDQTCDMKITAAKACVAAGVACGAPGLLPCGPGKQHPVLCFDGTYRLNCPWHASNFCGPMKHVFGTSCVANVVCTAPSIPNPDGDGTTCVIPQYDKQGPPRPTSSPSTYTTTTVAPTCCAIIHPSYGVPIGVIATPTPRPTIAATGTPTPIATYRPGTVATGTPTPIPTATYRPGIAATATPTPIPSATYSYRPPPREPLPVAIIEKKPDIGQAPSRPIEVISHGGGGQNTYVAKPVVTTTTAKPVFVNNTPAQPYRAPPTAFVHTMPAAAVVRPVVTPMKKP